VDIGEIIKDILVAELFVELPPGEVRDDDGLQDVFGLDSLGFVELRVQCEERFGVQISDDDFSPEHFSTIRDVVALVERLVAEKEAAAAGPVGADV
jgi:acyl carrier protein